MKKYFLTGLTIMLLAGCASTQQDKANKADPYEDFNRHMYAFNTGIDKAIIRPIAIVYQTVLPSFVRTGVTNAFNNIDMIPTVFNDIFQGNSEFAAKDTSRFLINSTIGLAGLLDIAKQVNLPFHKADFGLTLAKWGYKNSNYLVLPLFGPATVRDAIGLPVNYAVSIYPYINDQTAYILTGVELINNRSNTLNYDSFIYQAFDPYIALKNAYLQRREGQIAQTINKP